MGKRPGRRRHPPTPPLPPRPARDTETGPPTSPLWGRGSRLPPPAPLPLHLCNATSPPTPTALRPPSAAATRSACLYCPATPSRVPTVAALAAARPADGGGPGSGPGGIAPPSRAGPDKRTSRFPPWPHRETPQGPRALGWTEASHGQRQPLQENLSPPQSPSVADTKSQGKFLPLPALRCIKAVPILPPHLSYKDYRRRAGGGGGGRI